MSIKNYDVICDIEAELARARGKFPSNRHMMNALTEEVGELAKALIQLNFEPNKKVTQRNVYDEAVQVAVMAIRVATEGDNSLPEYDPESGYRGIGWVGYKKPQSNYARENRNKKFGRR